MKTKLETLLRFMFALTIGKSFWHDFLRGQFPANKNFKKSQILFVLTIGKSFVHDSPRGLFSKNKLKTNLRFLIFSDRKSLISGPPWGNVPATFFVLPDCRPKIIHSLPKDLQAPSGRAKMAGCGSGGLQNHARPENAPHTLGIEPTTPIRWHFSGHPSS